jgi:magnesium transporter
MEPPGFARAPLISGLGPEQQQEIQRCRGAARFFWLDVLVDGEELDEDEARTQLKAQLGVPEHALDVLFALPDSPLLRKYHADGEHVVFAFSRIMRPDAPLDEGADAIEPVEVHVLVHGDYLLTVHDRVVQLQPPPEESPPAERGEKYLVFFALFEMTITLFDTLNDLGEKLQQLEGAQIAGRSNPATDRRTIPGLRARLTELRRLAGRQMVLFSHVAEEIEQVRGLEGSGRYFERIDAQLGRLVDGIDAQGYALAALIDQGMNRTMFRLTVVATIFLPLTVLTGFFGMNFGWLVGEITSQSDFLIFGVGSLVAAIVIAVTVMRRDLPVLIRRG